MEEWTVLETSPTHWCTWCCSLSTVVSEKQGPSPYREFWARHNAECDLVPFFFLPEIDRLDSRVGNLWSLQSQPPHVTYGSHSDGQRGILFYFYFFFTGCKADYSFLHLHFMLQIPCVRAGSLFYLPIFWSQSVNLYPHTEYRPRAEELPPEEDIFSAAIRRNY